MNSGAWTEEQTRAAKLRHDLMTSQEIAWLAGLLEGEGTFGWKKHSPEHPGSPIVQVKMTDLDVVQRVANLWGTKVYHEKYSQKRKSHWKPVYRALVQGGHAAVVMKQIRPFMGLRRGARIDELLERWLQSPAVLDDRRSSWR